MVSDKRPASTARPKLAQPKRPRSPKLLPLQRHLDLAPSHPGALLREIVVPATGQSKTRIAELLGVSRQTLNELLTEKAAVTPNLALRLDRMFGNGPEIWLRMQAAHDVWHTARALADELAAIPRLETADG